MVSLIVSSTGHKQGWLVLRRASGDSGAHRGSSTLLKMKGPR